MKWVKRIVIALVVLIVLVMGAAFLFIDPIAKAGVVYGANYALGVPTTLTLAHVSLMSGSVSLHGLEVANPQGFKSPHFLTLGSADVETTLSSLNSNTVMVNRFELNGIDMNLEKSGAQTNYGVIMENLKKLESGDKAKQQPTTQKKGFVIKELVIKDVVVHADMAGFGGSMTKLDVKIPEIKMNNVGTENQSAAISEVTDVIIKAVLEATMNKLGDQAKALVDDLGKGLGGLTKLSDMGVKVVGVLGKQVGEITETVGKEVGKKVDEVGKNVGDALKGILPK